MHELALTQEIVSRVCERVDGARVKRIVLEIGMLAGVSADAIRYCFELCAEDTALAGATLEIREVPGQAQCEVCGRTIVIERPFGICACGSTQLRWKSGQELRIHEVELVS